MVNNLREKVFDRRMKTNNYDDISLEEMRGRIRRIEGHRTSSLSDIKNFQNNIDISSLKGKDGSTILISESTLLELKQKVDESETQKHFMNALKERLKETSHEKDNLIKKSQIDQEIIKKNNEEIILLKEEISKLNNNISELKEILESSKQKIIELERSNDGNNILTGVDMQSRIDSMSEFNFKNKGEMKTLQDELLLNYELSSNSSIISNKTSEKSIRHVLFNDVAERFGESKIFNNSNKNIENINIGNKQIRNDIQWINMMTNLNNFIFFKSKILLLKRFIFDEEQELLNELNNETNKNRKSNNIGYSGPNENKIKIVFSSIKIFINEMIYKMDNVDNMDDENVLNEKKKLLKIVDEQINYLKDKIDNNNLNSTRSSNDTSRIASFSDILTDKESLDNQTLNSSKSSKFSQKMKNNIDNNFAINRKLLRILVRVKFWLIEEILYDEHIVDNHYDIEDKYSLNSESSYKYMLSIEKNEDYSLNNNIYLSTGVLQILYILNKQWERSIKNEDHLLNQLQQMVRIYHRLKSCLLTSKNNYIEDINQELNLNNVYNIDSLDLSNENSFVVEVEKELTSLGLGILSGRDLSKNNTNRSNVTEELYKNTNNNNINNVNNNMNDDNLLRREQVNDILKQLERYPDPFIANKNEILTIRELIRPLKSYGRRAPEPYIGFFAMMTQRLDNDIIQHDREIRAFQKVIKGLEDQCDRQQEELEELHEELEQLYDIIESIEEKDDKNNDNESRSQEQCDDKSWISLCKQTSLGLSEE